jgi:hypothetical protein
MNLRIPVWVILHIALVMHNLLGPLRPNKIRTINFLHFPPKYSCLALSFSVLSALLGPVICILRTAYIRIDRL